MQSFRRFSTAAVLWMIPACLFLAAAVFILPLGGIDRTAFAALAQWETTAANPFLAPLHSALLHPVWGLVIQTVFMSWLLLLLQQMVERYDLTENRCIFPLAIFLLVAAFIIPLYVQPAAAWATLLSLTGLSRLFDCYKQAQCNRALFDAFFCFTTAAVAVPPLIGLVPLMWILFLAVNVPSAGRLLSSLAGIATLLWTVWGLLFLTGRTEWLTAYHSCLQADFITTVPLTASPWFASTGGKLFFAAYCLTFVCAVVAFWHRDRGRRRSVTLYSLMLQLFWGMLTLAACCFPKESVTLTWISLFPYSITLGQFFFEHDNRLTRLLLAGLIAALAGSFVLFQLQK